MEPASTTVASSQASRNYPKNVGAVLLFLMLACFGMVQPSRLRMFSVPVNELPIAVYSKRLSVPGYYSQSRDDAIGVDDKINARSNQKDESATANITETTVTNYSPITARDDQPCRNFPETVSTYIHAVKQDPERMALVGTPTTEKAFPPPFNVKLLHSAFQGKRLALVGDSTLYYSIRWLHALMNATHEAESLVDSLSVAPEYSHNLTHAVGTMYDTYGLDFFQHQMRPTQFVREYNARSVDMNKDKEEQAQFLWKGFNGVNMGSNCKMQKEVWSKITDYKPDILVANWGLHTFFLQNRGVRLCNVDQWVHMEDWWQTVIQVAQDVGTKVVLFKSTNLLCFVDEEMEMVNSNAKCLEKMNGFVTADTQYNLTKVDIALYCRDGLMRESSSQKLNKRLRKFVERTQKELLATNSTLKVEYFNDHDMHSCAYTAEKDGRHYHTLQLPRLRLLAHMIQCLEGVTGFGRPASLP